MENLTKEKEKVEKNLEESEENSKAEVEKLNNIVKTLEEELFLKSEKNKEYESKIDVMETEKKQMETKVKDMARTLDKYK